MKHVTMRSFADPAVAARKLLEIANATEAVQDGRIHIEKINGPFLFKEGGTPAANLLHRRRRAQSSSTTHWVKFRAASWATDSSSP